MKKDKLFRVLAQLLNARARCANDGDKTEWFQKHSERIEALVKKHFPSGAGFDNGTKINIDNSSDETLVFHTSFHHMDENGMYDGWTEHVVQVEPSLAFEFTLKISGKNKNDIKEYIHEVFHESLSTEV